MVLYIWLSAELRKQMSILPSFFPEIRTFQCPKCNSCHPPLRHVYFFRLTTSFLFYCRAGIIEGSAMVEVSPSSLSSAAILRRMRRMILPERVFGSDGSP